MLKKRITPELRTQKGLNKTHKQVPYEPSTREKEMKEELHEIRMKLLKKELEMKENQFFAELEINTEKLKVTQVDYEIKLVQKQIEEIKLQNLRKD